MCVVISGLGRRLVMAALAMEDSASGKDAIAEGLLDLLKPSVQQLDLHVHSMRESQVELREHIDNLASVSVSGGLSPRLPDPNPSVICDALSKILNVLTVAHFDKQLNRFELVTNILIAKLGRINEHQKVALDLDPYVKKLLNARRRVVLVNNILQNAQERLRRLNHNVAKETARRKTMLEASGAFITRSSSKP